MFVCCCSFEKEINGSNNVPGYRFTPPENVFASVEENPDNECFCPHGPPCTPSGFFNVSLCQYGNKQKNLLRVLLLLTQCKLQILQFYYHSHTFIWLMIVIGLLLKVLHHPSQKNTECIWMYNR